MFLLVLLLAWAQLVSPKPSSKTPELDTEVLILGAGIAGISAAKTLSENGVSDFIILEAEDRIGGRVKSTVLKTNNTRIELGANWIQGIDPKQPERHPLWSIAQKCGGLGGNFVKDFNNGTMHVFDENGRNITNSRMFKERLLQWNKILSPGLDHYSVMRQKVCLRDVTVKDALNAGGWIPTTPIDNLIEWYGFDLDEYATGPQNVSLYMNFPDGTYDDFGNPNRTENYFVTDQEEGFVKVVRCLSEDFLSKEDKRLILNSVVTEVDWSSKNYVCVTAKGKDDTVRKYCASYAIFTFSLGVLQSNAVKFIPSLPAVKKNAINKCDFLLYLKIFLEFEEEFWRQDANVDNFLRVDAVRGRYMQFQPVRKSLPILFTTVTGDIAQMVYNQSVKETTDQIMTVLRSIFGENTPEPIKVTIPDWWVNPLYSGMFSSTPIGCDSDVVKILAQRVGRLYFGGEATNEKYMAFVHGGYFSGIDAANKILRSRM